MHQERQWTVRLAHLVQLFSIFNQPCSSGFFTLGAVEPQALVTTLSFVSDAPVLCLISPLSIGKQTPKEQVELWCSFMTADISCGYICENRQGRTQCKVHRDWLTLHVHELGFFEMVIERTSLCCFPGFCLHLCLFVDPLPLLPTVNSAQKLAVKWVKMAAKVATSRNKSAILVTNECLEERCASLERQQGETQCCKHFS